MERGKGRKFMNVKKKPPTPPTYTYTPKGARCVCIDFVERFSNQLLKLSNTLRHFQLMQVPNTAELCNK